MAILDSNLQRALANQYVSSLVLIFFIMYAGIAAPKLPPTIAHLFDYSLFKMLILALILYVNNFSPAIAITVAIGFFISLQTLSRNKLFDMAHHWENIKGALPFGEEAPEVAEQEDTSVENTQVSGMASRTSEYMGPQGMKEPMGYPGKEDGASF